MNAEAIGDNRLLSAKVQMAYGGLAALRELKLSSNEFSGRLPDSLRRLTEMRLDYVSLTGTFSLLFACA